MNDWEAEFDELLVACFNKADIEENHIHIRGKDLPTTKAFIQRLLDEQAERFFQIVKAEHDKIGY